MADPNPFFTCYDCRCYNINEFPSVESTENAGLENAGPKMDLGPPFRRSAILEYIVIITLTLTIS